MKKFRDIFGQFEYYLEIVDCLSANFTDKSPDTKGNRSAKSEVGKNRDELSKFNSSRKIDPERNSNLQNVNDFTADDTSKKLVKMYI